MPRPISIAIAIARIRRASTFLPTNQTPMADDEHPLQSAWSSALHGVIPVWRPELTDARPVWEHNRGAGDNYGTSMKKLGDFSTVSRAGALRT